MEIGSLAADTAFTQTEVPSEQSVVAESTDQDARDTLFAGDSFPKLVSDMQEASIATTVRQITQLLKNGQACAALEILQQAHENGIPVNDDIKQQVVDAQLNAHF